MMIKGLCIAAILTAVLLASGPIFAACPSTDLTGDCIVDLDDLALLAAQWLTSYDFGTFSVMAQEWLTEGTFGPDIIWATIDEPAFSGQMSKYETTNAQYCQFLNEANASGDIIVIGDFVHGASGSNPGADYSEEYYALAGEGYTNNGITNGGAARILWDGSVFSVEAGFENHPVTYVSWYGSMAFCNYYGWRLPTALEWQAVADYDGSFIYGCGPTIDNSLANYDGSIHPEGTTEVGAFGVYGGYEMADMAGNVWEWTVSLWDPAYSYRLLSGGSWFYLEEACEVSYRYPYYPINMNFGIGFRVCR